MGLIIPLYAYPTDATWRTVAQQAALNPTAKLTVIINPDNGVGLIRDTAFGNGIRTLKASGCVVLGYVATSYGLRALADVAKEAAQYSLWYNVDGIFYDEWETGYVPHPTPGVSIGNPGTDAAPAMFPLITYETAGMPPGSFQGNYIAHTVPDLPLVYPKPQYYYITDDPATYQVLPSYFSALVAGDALGQTSGTSPPPPAPGKRMTLTVDGKTYSWNVT